MYITLLYTGPDEKGIYILKQIKFFNSRADITHYLEKYHYDLVETNESKVILSLKELINDYLTGKKVNLYEKVHELDIDLNLKKKFSTDFSRNVMDVVSKLKYGEKISYSGIGAKINSKAYRAIGNVLKKNPLPLIIPCHRIIKKDGSLGGFMGKTGNKWQQDLKRILLKIER